MHDVTISSSCFAPLVDAIVGEENLRPQVISGPEMPEPYRTLLVNQGDMTSTLERFHDCILHLEVRSCHHEGADYRRQVTLLDPHETAVEYGAIRIYLDVLTEPVRQDVLAKLRPLGGVLVKHGIPHTSHPSAFFSISPSSSIRAALQLSNASAQLTLYGRCNTLVLGDGRAIAEVVEILPPHPRPN